MAQVSWRADDEVVERARRAARSRGRSLNEFITIVMAAVSNPATAGTEAAAVRERLALAGLLESSGPGGTRAAAVRPSADDVRAAGQRAATGTPLDELISSDR